MVYFKIKENSKQAKTMIEFLKTLSFVEIIDEKKVFNNTTLLALKESDEGNLKTFDSVDSLFEDLNN